VPENVVAQVLVVLTRIVAVVLPAALTYHYVRNFMEYAVPTFAFQRAVAITMVTWVCTGIVCVFMFGLVSAWRRE
jgi:hypothetical protein